MDLNEQIRDLEGKIDQRVYNGEGGRPPGSLNKPGQVEILSRLGPQHMTMLALRATGMSVKEVAVLCGVVPGTVTYAINHPDAQEVLGRLISDHVSGVVEDVGEMIKAASKEAFLTNLDLMRNAKKEEVRRDCAQDILDRAGFTARINAAPPPVVFGEVGAAKIVKALEDNVRPLRALNPVGTAKEVLVQMKDEGEE